MVLEWATAYRRRHAHRHRHRRLPRPRTRPRPRARRAPLAPRGRRPPTRRAAGGRRRAGPVHRRRRAHRRRRGRRAPARAAGRGRRAGRPAGQQRLPPRPEPPAAARGLSPGRAGACLSRQRAGPARADPARAPAAPRGSADRQRHLGRRRRALRGLGRLRLRQGGARPPQRDPRRRARRPAGVRRRPRRHEHAHAPGGVPRRGHLRPPAARGERARPARPDRGRAAQRPLPGARAQRGAGMRVAMGIEAAAPPPVRDEVRLMVAQDARPLVHTTFLDLPTHLRAGDLLIVNASATIPAALPARRADGTPVDLHLSTPDPHHPDRWVFEVRRNGRRATATAETLQLPAGATATLEAPYLSAGRLWIARLELPTDLLTYLNTHGAPIRYAHEPHARPLADHQTIFATELGSAEMPSAGRPFTKRVLTDLRR